MDSQNVLGFFGGTEITYAIGHVILLTVECLLLYILMIDYLPEMSAKRWAALVTLVLATIVEVTQLWITFHGVSLIDIAAAFVGVSIAWWIIYYYLTLRRQANSSTMPVNSK